MDSTETGHYGAGRVRKYRRVIKEQMGWTVPVIMEQAGVRGYRVLGGLQVDRGHLGGSNLVPLA